MNWHNSVPDRFRKGEFVQGNKQEKLFILVENVLKKVSVEKMAVCAFLLLGQSC